MQNNYHKLCPNCRCDMNYQTEDIVHLTASNEDVVKCPMCLEYSPHSEEDRLIYEDSFSFHALKCIDEIKSIPEGDMIFAQSADLTIYAFEKGDEYRIVATKKK